MRTAVAIAACLISTVAVADDAKEISALQKVLKSLGFTGKVEQTIPTLMGRPIDPERVELGRLIFFDKGLGLHRDNSCAGCHSPTKSMGDTQPLAIGIQSGVDPTTKQEIVGPSRTGPRNQRRTPTVVNVGMYPVLMWNGRFHSPSGSAFDNKAGFVFPTPEGDTFFTKNDPRYKHLLVAQAHIPFTEMPEMAGFTGLCKTFVIQPKAAPSVNAFRNQTAFQNFRVQSAPIKAKQQQTEDPNCYFDDGLGKKLPAPFPDSASLNAPIRDLVLDDINQMLPYRERFKKIYPSVATGNPIEFWMIGEALSEFQVSLTFMDAPLDKFARGDTAALPADARKGALVFFDKNKGNCIACHAVAGQSKELFSDFKMHNAGVPQIAPKFGKGTGNVMFRDVAGNQVPDGRYDLGQFENENTEETKFKFRTSPLRNVGLQAAFFHNGAFTRLEDAVRYHTDTLNQAASYDPAAAGVPVDLRNVADLKPVLQTLAKELQKPAKLSADELKSLVAFLAVGLTDERAKPASTMKLIPQQVPSGATLHKFVP